MYNRMGVVSNCDTLFLDMMQSARLVPSWQTPTTFAIRNRDPYVGGCSKATTYFLGNSSVMLPREDRRKEPPIAKSGEVAA